MWAAHQTVPTSHDSRLTFDVSHLTSSVKRLTNFFSPYAFRIKTLLKIKNPTIPDINEATIIAIFAWLINSADLNARSLINIDIVNPTPARMLTPQICDQVMPFGKLVLPERTASQLHKRMPSCLPKN